MATQSLGASVSHLLIEASQSFSADIYRRTINTSPFLKLIKQSTWPDEMGDTISVITYERTLPNNANTWNSIDSASTKFAVPDATQVSVAQTLRQFSLSHTAIESQPIAVNDIRMGFKFREQIKSVYDNLVENVAWLWIKRYRDEYRRLCGTKVAATVIGTANTVQRSTGTFYLEGASVNSDKTGILTQSLLNKLYMELIRDGAGNRPMGMENGRPIFTLVCSPECSDALIRLNPSIRNDYRESSQVNELLKPLGVERSYRGFYHLIDVVAPRYNAVTAAIAAGTSTAKVEEVDATQKLVRLTIGGSGATMAHFIPGRAFSMATASNNQGGAITSGVVVSVTATSTSTGTVLVNCGSFSNSGYVAVGSGVTGTLPTYTFFNPRVGPGTALSFSTAADAHYVEVPFYIPDSDHTPSGPTSTKRNIVNPSYYTADFEEAFIMHPEVMESLIPAPLTSAGAGTSFNPVNYRGDFKFLNIQHRTENPDGTWGYYRGVLASGSKPNKPQFGMAILYKRIPDVGLVVADPGLQGSSTLYTEATGDKISP